MLKMIDAGPFVTDLDIKRLEKKCKVNLPSAYKAFLLNYNGGHCDPAYFPLVGFKNNPVGHIQLFYSINHPIECCSPGWNYETFLGRMPSGFFPFACEDGGNILCLSLIGNDSGAVYYWDHDAETNPPTFDNVYKVADSFEAFLDSIHFVDISTI